MQIAIATTAIDNIPFVGTEYGLIPSLKQHGIEAEFVIRDANDIHWPHDATGINAPNL